MRLNNYIIIAFSALLLLAYSCKPGQSVKKSTAVNSKFTERDRIEYDYLFFNANKEKMLGNYDLAANLFAQCIQKNVSDPAPVYEIARIYDYQKKYSEALYFSRSAATMDSKNIWFQLFYGECLQKNKKFSEAAEVYAKLVKNNPDRADLYYEWASALFYGGKLNEAVKIYDQLEHLTGISEEICVRKQQIYIKLGNIEKAAGELKKLVEANPGESRFLLMLAELYQINGLNKNAFDIYEQVIKVDPKNSYVHLSLAEYYRTQGDMEKAFSEMKLAFEGEDLNIDLKVKILLGYYDMSETSGPSGTLKTDALELCKILINTHPKEAKSYSIYGDFLYREKQLHEARNNYRAAIELDKSRFPLWNQLLSIDSELEDYEAMNNDSKEIIELFPQQPVPYLLNGIALIQKKEYQKSIEVLEEGSIIVVDNKSLLTQFYANLGDAHNYIKDHKQSDYYYEKALELDPNNIYVLNNYSYYLSLRGEKLDRAVEMSAQTNKIEPNNSSYMDTYGWILYKNSNLEEAKIWLEKAIENGGNNNSVILEHYGDVLFRLNEKQKALEFWKMAKDKGKGSEALERKIADKNLYE